MYATPMGYGTVLDNYLILKLKEGKFAGDPAKLAAVVAESSEYEPIARHLQEKYPEILDAMNELFEIHGKLWYIEDRKRQIEKGEQVDPFLGRILNEERQAELIEYLTLSREVSLYNDRRAQLKKTMNTLTHSAIVEVKSHKTV